MKLRFKPSQRESISYSLFINTANGLRLPAERRRHDELRDQIGDRLSVNRTLSVLVKATFRHVPLDGKNIETQVQWIALDSAIG